MEDVINQLLAGDMTHRNFFIEFFKRPVRNLITRYISQHSPTNHDDLLGEGYLALCHIPDELSVRYKNEPTEVEVWKYIRTRIITAMYRFRKNQHLMGIPHSTLVRNTKLQPIKQVTHIFPGERFGIEKATHVPIPIFDLLSSPVDPPKIEIVYKGLTGVEWKMIEDLKAEMPISDMATKYGVSRKTIRNRMDSIRSKMIIKKEKD